MRETTKDVTGWLLLGVVCVLCLHLGERALWDPDEGRYAEMAREMLVLDDWVTPHLDRLLYFEKPMMFMWMMGLSYKAFGVGEFAARLVPLLCALGGALLVYLMGRCLWGRRAGTVAALCLLTSLEYGLLSRAVDINMPLTFFITATMVSFWWGIRQDRARWIYLAWACSGCAVLTKGPVGLILPAGSIGLYILVTRQWGLVRRARPLSGLAVLLLVSAPWYVAVMRTNPDFGWFFFIDQNFQRFTTVKHHRYQPWWWFFPVIAAGLLPWTVMLPRMGREMFGGRRWREVPRELWYVLCWFLVCFLFFVPSHSKLATYILPCFAPLALTAGWVLRRPGRSRAVWWAVGLWAVLGIVLCVLPSLMSRGLVSFSSDNAGPLMQVGPWLGGALLLAAVGGLWFERRGDAAAGLGVLGAVLLIAMVFVAPRWDQLRSTRELVSDLPADVPLLAYHRYFPSASFYAGRQVGLVDCRGELVFGIERAENEAWSMDEAAFVERARAGEELYLLTYERYLPALVEAQLSFVVTGRRNDLLVLHLGGSELLAGEDSTEDVQSPSS